ncbi:MAG: hypothetical protein EHM93_05855 [Bacteroidales bacterium]|nr:MAG: hypothetical protein EHM93_05855 [Bacteroidales bacterium]
MSKIFQVRNLETLVIILLLFTACTKKEEASYNIVFNVFDRNFKPVQGATIVVNNTILPETNEKGIASTILKAGNYTYKITANNFSTIEKDLTVIDFDCHIHEKLVYVTYQVSFNTEGGSAIPNQMVSYGDLVPIPKNPIKEGWSFDAWIMGDTKFDFSTPVKSDIVLTARWGYAVLFVDGNKVYSKVAPLPLKKIAELPVPSAEYCTFDCWASYSKETGFVKFDEKTEVLSDSIVVYAKWEVTDVDGNEYPAVKIRYDLWMLANLKVTKYNDNTEIPLVEDATIWESLTTPAYCNYNNEAQNKNIYGNLYNFYTIEKNKLCPTGWHIADPSDMDFLEMSMGMPFDIIDNISSWHYRGTNEGSKLAGSPELWTDGALKQDSKFATSSFNAVPSGLRGKDGGFEGIGKKSIWWYTSSNTNYIYYRFLSYDDSRPYSYMYTNYQKNYGLSVRCVGNKSYSVW